MSDDDIFVDLALAYSENHQDMYTESRTVGITNGAQWYALLEGYKIGVIWTKAFDVTLGQNEVKWPNQNLYQGLWDENREAMISYIERVHGPSVKGVVIDADSDYLFHAQSLLGVTRM